MSDVSAKAAPPASYLFSYRVGLSLEAVLILAFWLRYQVLEPPVWDPLWIRGSITAALLGLVVLTFVSEWVRRSIETLVYGAIHLLTVWVVVLAAANGFHEAYLTGVILLFSGFVLGLAVIGPLERRRTRFLYFAGFSVATTGIAAFAASVSLTESIAAVLRVVAINGVGLFLVECAVRIQTTLAQSEAAARISEERYRRVFRNVRDVLFEIDAEGRWVLLSPAWTRLTGFTVEESLGRHFLEIIPEENHVETLRRIRTFLERGEEIYDRVVRIRTRSGEGRWSEIRARLSYGPDGAVTGVAGTLTDVTDSVRAQAEHEARERAEELLRLKTAFLNSTSHELRTPLTGILGFSEILAEEVEGEHAEFARLIHTSASRLLDTVNSVLDLAELEGRRVELRRERVDVGAEATEAARLLASLAREKGLRLDVQVPEDGAVAELDRHALHRILTNLLGNAIKFTSEGRVRVCAEVDPERVRLHVEDTGIGIPPAFRPYLFEPFRQESDGLARRHEGNGLGLSITKRLVDLMGGTIQVDSKLGTGTRFTVEVPRWSPATGDGKADSERDGGVPTLSIRQGADLDSALGA